MFCSNCGTAVPEDANNCPNCGYFCGKAENVEAVPVNNGNGNNEKGRKKGPSKGSKNYAAMMTALMVFPATFCTAIDLCFHRHDFWFGYVVGAMIVLWICMVFPTFKITPPAVTSMICVGSVFGYVSYIVYKNGAFEWIYQRLLPLFILFLIFMWLTVYLVSAGKIRGLTSAALISAEIGVYIVACEAFFSKGLDNLHWSPILACGFISLSALLIAINYIKNNKE